MYRVGGVATGLLSSPVLSDEFCDGTRSPGAHSSNRYPGPLFEPVAT